MRRRRFLLQLAGGVAGGLAGARWLASQQAEPLGGQGSSGSLRDPLSAGPPRQRVTPGDNDELIRQVEQRLRCTCGCTLDVYTCRTTDFTCTYSPDLHREALALRGEGRDADQIVAAFVEKYGEKILMAPPADGFNLAGYLVPGAAILVAGSAMILVLRRRSRRLAAVSPPTAGTVAPAVTVSAADQAELQRALREDEL